MHAVVGQPAVREEELFLNCHTHVGYKHFARRTKIWGTPGHILCGQFAVPVNGDD